MQSTAIRWTFLCCDPYFVSSTIKWCSTVSHSFWMILPGFPRGGPYSCPYICHVDLGGLAPGCYFIYIIEKFMMNLFLGSLSWWTFTGATPQNSTNKSEFMCFSFFLQLVQNYYLHDNLSAVSRYLCVSCVNFHDTLHTTLFKMISESIIIPFARGFFRKDHQHFCFHIKEFVR